MKNLKIIIIKKDIDYSWLWLWEPPKIDNLAAGIPPNPNLQAKVYKENDRSWSADARAYQHDGGHW